MKALFDLRYQLSQATKKSSTEVSEIFTTWMNTNKSTIDQGSSFFKSEMRAAVDIIALPLAAWKYDVPVKSVDNEEEDAADEFRNSA